MATARARATGDWMPSNREARVAMARKWIEVLAARATEWKFTPQETAALMTLTSNSASANTAALEGSGNRVLIAKANQASRALVALMRRYHARFRALDLEAADWLSLGLNPPDTTRTPINAPTVGATGIISYPGVHLIEVRDMRPAEDGAEDLRAKWGFRIHYGILAEPADGGSFRILRVPETAADLPHSVFTRRRRHQFDFMGDSGKRVFVAICYENAKGDSGPFGPMMEAVIP